LTAEQRKAMWAIESCRTARLGGHLEVCSSCGYSEPAYNSCRNRHCPKCLNLAQGRWLNNQRSRLLPTFYFHVVFTLPRELRAVTLQNRRIVFDLLFKAAAETLVAFGKDRLGALIGFTAVLHTWTRELVFHPHLHCIVTGGGLAGNALEWTPSSPRYLFPVKALSKLFRGKFLEKLSHAFDKGLIHYRSELGIDDDEAFRLLKDKLYRKDWLVYSKRPFAGPERLLDYLGRYTHRVAISSHRLIRIDRAGICFATKDGKTITLSPEEFLSRFLDHVLPARFVKIRHYGLLASANANKLTVAQNCLGLAPSDDHAAESPVLSWQERFYQLTGIDLTRCPICNSKLRSLPLALASPPPGRAPP
jgi:hypothetical protein